MTSFTPDFRLKWDVFLSFRGEDTRRGFTANLYSALEAAGVRVFRDNDGLNRGDEIDPGLLDAIEDSAAAITIISRNYASSRWCLKELARICCCRCFILPVFYHVDPFDVRHQRGPFESSFCNLEERFGKDDVIEWRKAMEKAGGIAGWVFQNSEESHLIQSLVKRVLTELRSTPVAVAAYTVGLDSRLEELRRLLLGNIQILGLHGVGGAGKTTLAKVLYNNLVKDFESRCFISNVREVSSQQNGLLALQNKFIQDISAGMVQSVAGYDAAIIKIKEMVHERKVLVVLDDVDDINQLNALAGRREWFCEESRIIITTRNQEVLHQHRVDMLYEVEGLDPSDSLKLFSYHALRRENPTETFYNLSKQIVSLTGGLPLALEVFGSYLFNKRRIEEWDDALQKLQEICPGRLQDVLKISFDGLDEQEKCIFLDIACLFIKTRMKKEDAIDIWNGCGLRGELAVAILMAKSLIKITEDNELWMHDQVRDMGRQIVLHENLVYPGMRSRLWNRAEIMGVLNADTGTRHVQGIVLDFEEKVVRDLSAQTLAQNDFWRKSTWRSAIISLMEVCKTYFYQERKHEEEMLRTRSFQAMLKLRLLQINHLKVEGKFKHIPAGLRWFQWKGCPLEILPPDFFPRELAVLDLSESKVKQLWSWRWWNWRRGRVARNLEVMNLHGCCNLNAIPDLSGNRAMRKLILEHCKGLYKIHKSLADLNTLIHLNLRGCKNLLEFPSDVSGLNQLESLILSGCKRLKELPKDMSGMNSLRELLIDDTAIEQLPESIFHLSKLEKLSLDGCQSLRGLPVCIGMLTSLRELSLYNSAVKTVPDSIKSLTNLEKLNLMRCQSLTFIPDSVGELKLLKELLLGGSSIKELPASISSLYYLKNLSLGGCHDLSKLPVSVQGLASLLELQLNETSITSLPDQIGALKTLDQLQMRNCKSFKTLPESIGGILTLSTLIIVGAAITELPESIGLLENLTFLTLNKCKQLCRLPASIGNLRSLHHLLLEETAVAELPESFGMLSNLMILRMAKEAHLELPQNAEPSRLKSSLAQVTSKVQVLPVSFPNLCALSELDARSWKISGKIPDDFAKLSSLKILNLGYNDFFSLPSSLRSLTILEKLLLPHCKELRSLPPLPSSLQELDAAHCTALESISDLSNLEKLWSLHLTNCDKLVDVPGFECLKSLKYLNMSGCSGCSSKARAKLSKAALKRLYNLSIPGSEIPDWFSKGVVRFSTQKHRAIKYVIVGVVVSANEHAFDDSIYQRPGIADFEAVIYRLNKRICNATLKLMGVPKAHEDQVYLCRYLDFQSLVFNLSDGDTIKVVKRRPAIIEGLELKQSGIHLVFENDDDYDGDEGLLDESQQSVSVKLANFFDPCDRVSHAFCPDSEVASNMKTIREGMFSEHRYSFFLFSVLSSLALLMSLLWLKFRCLSV